MKKFIIISFLLIINCAGSRVNIKFDKLNYPASTTIYLRSIDGHIYSRDDELDIVAPFDSIKSYWSVFYSLAPLSDKNKQINELNKLISQNSGDGVIDLEFAADGCLLNNIPFVNILPIYPACVNVRMKGYIVRIRKQK